MSALSPKKSWFSVSLRKKILFFSIMLALIPLGVSSTSMITITRDELKSAVNDRLINTSEQIAKEIDDLYLRAWLMPLMVIRDAIDNQEIGADEKISILKTGISNIGDFISLGLCVGDFPPALFIKDDFKQGLEKAGVNPVDVLSAPGIKTDMPDTLAITGKIKYIPAADTWVLPIGIPLKNKISDNDSLIIAHVNLNHFKLFIENHPFNKTGQIKLIDENGHEVFNTDEKDLSRYKPVESAKNLIKAGLQAVSAEPFIGDDNEKMLGSYAIPANIKMGVIVTIDEKHAYLAIRKMINYLTVWLAAGLAAAIFGAFLFSSQITRPITKIGMVVKSVGHGDLNVRVGNLNTRDEISTLGNRIDEMIQGLLEHFHLQKFVSGQTMDAVRLAGGEGVKLGGERKYITVFFSDIRNFTAFSESVEPETVIEMLNTYLRAQAKIVRKYDGDIDKYVGDELIAVFQGEDMVKNAVVCACEIHEIVGVLNKKHPQWNIGVGIGINTGYMVMGAMGSEERMDYTILGDNVNLGARLCSHAKACKTIISESSYNHLSDMEGIEITRLDPITVKGKAKPVQIYEASGRYCLIHPDHVLDDKGNN